MCGSRARTNFVYSANELEPSSTKFLSAALIAKLQRCHMTSLKMAKRPPMINQGSQEEQCSGTRVDRVVDHGIGQRDNEMQIAGHLNQDGFGRQGESMSGQEFNKPLEDVHIEQMIQELLHYGSIELSSVMQN